MAKKLATKGLSLGRIWDWDNICLKWEKIRTGWSQWDDVCQPHSWSKLIPHWSSMLLFDLTTKIVKSSSPHSARLGMFVGKCLCFTWSHHKPCTWRWQKWAHTLTAEYGKVSSPRCSGAWLNMLIAAHVEWSTESNHKWVGTGHIIVFKH